MEHKNSLNKIETTKEEIVEYDDLLSSAGQFGLYQYWLLFTTIPFQIFVAFVYYAQLFMTQVSSDHWCKIPELENLTDLERKHLAIPKDPNSRYGYSQCEMYSVNWSEVLASHVTPDSSWSTVPCQYGWEFNTSEIPYPTISSDLGWVCDRDSYQATAQAIFFVGSVVGGLIVGWIADLYGRIPAIVVSNLFGCIGGFASTYAQNFAEFCVARFVVGMAYDNCMIMAHLLLLEYVAPKYRTLIGNLSFGIFYSGAEIIVPWIALACGHWKTLSLVTSLPLGLAIFTPLVIPESPRWLLSKGRVDDAVNKVIVIGRVNKKVVPPKLIEQFKVTASNVKNQETHSCMEIFRRPLVKRTFITICALFMCCAFIFDVMIRYLGLLDFNYFVSFSLMCSTDFPSMILVAFIMDYTGRKLLTASMMIVTGIFCISAAFVSGVPTVVFLFIARFGCNMSYCATMQWAAEILPTSVRGSGVSLVHICAYVSSFISPYISYLSMYVSWLPLVVVGCVAALGVVLAINLPETAWKEMPQSFEEAEQLMINRKFWEITFLQKKDKGNGEVNPGFQMDIDEVN